MIYKKPQFTATIFFKPAENKKPRAYRYGITQQKKFAAFAAQQGAIYVNWYDKKTGAFCGRQWLTNEFGGG